MRHCGCASCRTKIMPVMPESAEAETAVLADGQGQRTFRTSGPILFFVAGVSLFAIMDGLGKFLAGDFPLLQLVWARYAFAIPIILATTSPVGWQSLLSCERPLLQAARGLLPLVASAAVLLGLRLMPLADATAITFAAPLFVVALSAPILRERVGTAAWVGVGLGFGGVLIVARPGLGSISWAALLPLATAFLFGLYQVLTRLASRSDSPATTLAWTILTGFVLTTPPPWRGPVPRDPRLRCGTRGHSHALYLHADRGGRSVRHSGLRRVARSLDARRHRARRGRGALRPAPSSVASR